MTTYAITGASGQLGSLAADLLLQQVDGSDVVLLSRTPETLADRFPGATVRAADFDRPETLAEAFAGVDELLVVSTDAVGARVEGHRNAVAAAAQAGVRRVLYTSLAGLTPDNPAGVVADHLATEEIVRASGLRWTMLRNALYADMQAGTIEQAAATGSLVTNTGTGGSAYVSRADCAAAAVAALLSTEVDDVALDVTGPQAVTADDLADLAAARRGSEVEVVRVDDEAYAAGLVGAGLPAEVAGLLASFGTSIREGHADEVTSAVEDLTGRAPRPLAEVVGA